AVASVRSRALTCGCPASSARARPREVVLDATILASCSSCPLGLADAGEPRPAGARALGLPLRRPAAARDRPSRASSPARPLLAAAGLAAGPTGAGARPRE